MDTVHVELPKAYGWVHEGSKAATNYGPGNVSIPRAMAEGLVSEGVLSEEVLTQTPPGGIPQDFPGRDELVAAGHTTLNSVREIEDLTEIDGIGKVTAEKIRKALG